MINYLKAEFYRIFSKKSMYIYFFILAALYGLMMFSRMSYLTSADALSEGSILMELLVFGGSSFIFSIVYNDDLSARSLASVIGYGQKKGMIILSKLLLAVIMNTFMYLAALLCFSGILFFIGAPVPASAVPELLLYMLQKLSITIAYQIIASIMVYGIQKPSFSIGFYLLLSTGFIGQLLSMLLQSGFITQIFGNLTGFMLSPIIRTMFDNVSPATVLPYLAYLIIAAVLSVGVFYKKELEF